MKKYFSILIIYLISTSTLFSQGPPIEESKTIALLSSTIYQNTSGQDVGYVSSIEYNIGYNYVEPNKRVYRSYFIVDLSVIPTNATIKTVSLEYFTEFKDETFKLTNIAALGGTNGAIWSSIGSSPTFHTGVAYGMSSFTSTPIKTAMQSALANRSMIIGALSTNEASINSKSNLSIVLTITYTRPPNQILIYVQNDMKGYSGGTIGYGIDAPPTPHSSPAVITAYENQTLNLEAYDNQVHINGKEFVFLDDEANDNESKWGYTTDDNFSKNKNYSRVLKSSDNGLTLKAFLRQKCYPTFQNSFIDNGQAGEIFVNNTLRTSPYNSDLVYEGNTITASSSTQIINGINFSFSRWEDNLTTNYRTFTIEDNETHTIYYTGKPSNYNRDVTFGTVLWDPIKVEWVDNVNTNVTYYQIWRKINGGTPVLVGSVNRGVQQFIDPDYYLANWKQFDRVEYDPRPYYSIEGTSATPLFVEIYGIQLKESEENQITEKKNIPTEFTITNYPNPFNPTTTINYQLPITSNVVIKVFDITGKEVAVLVNEKKEAGYYNINFDGGNLSSGIYIYSVQANENRISKKMLLVK